MTSAAEEADATIHPPFEPVEFTFPLRTTTGLNVREHPMVRAKRVRVEKLATAAALRYRDAFPVWSAAKHGERILVMLTRIAPRKCDTGDNLSGGLKAVRDQIAATLGVDDGPDGPIVWRYSQEKGRPREYAVRVRIEPLRCCVLCGQPVSSREAA